MLRLLPRRMTDLETTAWAKQRGYGRDALEAGDRVEVIDFYCADFGKAGFVSYSLSRGTMVRTASGTLAVQGDAGAPYSLRLTLTGSTDHIRRL